MRRPPGRALIVVALLAGHARAEAEVARVRLAEVVARAMASNPTVGVAAAELERARAIVREVRAASLPTLGASATYTRIEGDRVIGGTVIVPANQVQTSFLVTAPLFAPSRWVQVSHARDAVDVSRLSLVEARREIGVAAARTFLAIVAQHRALEVIDRACEAARAHLTFTHARYAGGVGNRLDEARAAQELASDESQRASTRLQLVQLEEALGVLAGGDAPLDTEADVELPRDDAPAELSRRPDLRLLERRLEAAEIIERDGWADYMPSLVATFQPMLQVPATPSLPEYAYTGLLTMAWPIFDGGLRYAQRQERAALVGEARLNLSGLTRQARSEERTALAEVDGETTVLGAAREAARLAAEQLALTSEAYRAGATTNIEVIDAERRARDADTAVVVAEDRAREAALDLLIARGRFPAGL